MENKEEKKDKLSEALEKYKNDYEIEVDYDELKRAIAFLLIFQDDAPFLPSAEYFLEKYVRYIKAPVVKDEYFWGLHPIVMRRFEAYCAKYNIPHDNKGVDNE